jgi:hypothetical protein
MNGSLVLLTAAARAFSEGVAPQLQVSAPLPSPQLDASVWTEISLGNTSVLATKAMRSAMYWARPRRSRTCSRSSGGPRRQSGTWSRIGISLPTNASEAATLCRARAQRPAARGTWLPSGPHGGRTRDGGTPSGLRWSATRRAAESSCAARIRAPSRPCTDVRCAQQGPPPRPAMLSPLAPTSLWTVELNNVLGLMC